MTKQQTIQTLLTETVNIGESLRIFCQHSVSIRCLCHNYRSFYTIDIFNIYAYTRAFESSNIAKKMALLRGDRKLSGNSRPNFIS